MQARKRHIIQTVDLKNYSDDFDLIIKYQRKTLSLTYNTGLCNILGCIYRNKDEISQDRLFESNLAVFGGPREPFSVAEFNELKAWLNSGGRALVMLGDGGEKQSGCNMNYLLEE